MGLITTLVLTVVIPAFFIFLWTGGCTDSNVKISEPTKIMKQTTVPSCDPISGKPMRVIKTEWVNND